MIFLCFISFHCPQLCYCSPCPSAGPASLNMHVVSTNFAKTSVWKREYDIVLWRRKQCISSKNDHHTPLLTTRIRKGGIQSSSRPGHHQTYARHWLLRPFNKRLVYDNLIRVGAASPPGSSTSCPTCGRFQHLREILSLVLSGQWSLLPPSGQESLRVWISIFPELILHAGSALKPEFYDFLTCCLRQVLEKSTNSCAPKAGKAIGNPKSYHPISLLRVPFKNLERLIYAHVEPIVYFSTREVDC